MGSSIDPSALFLVIDQGGHSTRAMVFDAQGSVVARGMDPITPQRPRPLWVEYPAQAMLDSLHRAIDRALAGLSSLQRGRLQVAGLATQRSNQVCWQRESGEALSLIISWQDRRNHRWLAQFTKQFSLIHRLTGLVPNAHYGASKLRWCLDQLPQVAAALEQGELAWGPMSSFFSYHLLQQRYQHWQQLLARQLSAG